MNPHFITAQELTPKKVNLQSYTKTYFEDNQIKLLRRGVPFIIKEFYSLAKTNMVIEKLTKDFKEWELSARFHTDNMSYSNSRKYQNIQLGEYLNLMSTDNRSIIPYAARNAIGEEITSYLEITNPTQANISKFKTPNIWIGPKGVETPLHKDSTDNFALQIKGTKKWVLFSIHEQNNMYYEKSIYGKYDHRWKEFEVSRVDLHNIDEELYPKFNLNSSTTIYVEEGDLLYIPYGWGHYVKSVTESIMINFWFEEKNFIPHIVSLRSV